MRTCDWCGHEYAEFNAQQEAAHLKVCAVFQGLPVAVWKDGKQFVALPGYPDILVERERAN